VQAEVWPVVIEPGAQTTVTDVMVDAGALTATVAAPDLVVS
jgi:hypothetical protein